MQWQVCSDASLVNVSVCGAHATNPKQLQHGTSRDKPKTTPVRLQSTQTMRWQVCSDVILVNVTVFGAHATNFI